MSLVVFRLTVTRAGLWRKQCGAGAGKISQIPAGVGRV